MKRKEYFKIEFLEECVKINDEAVYPIMSEDGIIIEFRGKRMKFKHQNDLCIMLEEKFDCTAELKTSVWDDFDGFGNGWYPDWCGSSEDYSNWCESEDF